MSEPAIEGNNALDDPNFEPEPQTPPENPEVNVEPDRPARNHRDREVVAPPPTFMKDSRRLVIPVVNGARYVVGDDYVSGALTVNEPVQVSVRANEGHYLGDDATTSWTFGE